MYIRRNTMAEVLSEEEIDELLLAISKNQVEVETDSQDNRTIKIYDFKRPRVFEENHHNLISLLHVFFARKITGSLSGLFSVLTSFHVVSVDELTFEEFSRSIPNPTLICTLSMRPFPFSIVLERAVKSAGLLTTNLLLE